MARNDVAENLKTSLGEHFVDRHFAVLVQRVKEVPAILDLLRKQKVLSHEQYDSIRAKDTMRDQVRLLYSGPLMSCGIRGKDIFLKALEELEPFLIEDLRDKDCPKTLPTDGPAVSKPKKDDRYPLTSKPIGICVIFDNENFQDGSKRRGTEKDKKSLAKVFHWLGCQVLICKDQTASDMAQVMEHLAALKDLAALQKHNMQEWSNNKVRPLSALPRHGDVFVCCILSHGGKGKVSGVDSDPLHIKEITSAFNGQHCSALVGKPKVFFIQACQGEAIQPGVEMDDLAPEQPEEDALIPVDADFLVAMATVEDYVSYRHPVDGSWFIQSLCEQLSEGCPRGEDIMEILYRVNNNVSETGEKGTVKKQMSEVKMTLRRRLVFSPR